MDVHPAPPMANSPWHPRKTRIKRSCGECRRRKQKASLTWKLGRHASIHASNLISIRADTSFFLNSSAYRVPSPSSATNPSLAVIVLVASHSPSVATWTKSKWQHGDLSRWTLHQKACYTKCNWDYSLHASPRGSKWTTVDEGRRKSQPERVPPRNFQCRNLLGVDDSTKISTTVLIPGPSGDDSDPPVLFVPDSSSLMRTNKSVEILSMCKQ